MFVEQRQKPRRRLAAAIEVLDAFSGRRVARLAELGDEGVMMTSETALEAETVLQVRTGMPPEITRGAPVEFGLQILWCQHDERDGQWHAGGRVISMAPELQGRLAAWVREGA